MNPKSSCHAVLVIPPLRTFTSRVFPLGVGYIASFLESNGCVVQIIDCMEKNRWDEEETVNEILTLNPLFIGFSVNSISYQVTKKLISNIKKKDPHIRIVAGGAHVSALPKESLEDLSCDFVVVGEAEEVFLKIIKRVEARIDSFDDIQGLAFWDGSEAKFNPGVNIIEDLDRLPFPARMPFSCQRNDDVGGDIFSLRSPVATILTSRGCPHQCTFCSSHLVHGRHFRRRSPRNVVDEIEFLVKKYGVKEINIVDDTFSEDKAHALGICEEIVNRKIDIAWRTAVGLRADTLDKELLSAFKASGCYKLAIGIESFSSGILKDIKKPVTKDALVNKIALVKSFDIALIGYFILGLPKDTEESIWETINFARKSDLDFPYFSHAVPFPGTEIFKQKYGGDGFSAIDWDHFNTFTEYSFNLSKVSSKRLRMFYFLAYFLCYSKLKRIKIVLKSLISCEGRKFSKIFIFLCKIIRNAF